MTPRLALLLLVSAVAKDDGLARSPPMGWSSWNAYHVHIDEAKLMAAADALVASGMGSAVEDDEIDWDPDEERALGASGRAAAGYNVLWIDAGWWATAVVRDANGTNRTVAVRNASGFLAVDAAKFPRGLRAVSDYAHARGLLFGAYTDGGRQFCTGELNASAGFERQDAALFDAWRADALKIDHCDASADGDIPADAQAPTMERWSRALDATGRAWLVQNCGVGCAPYMQGHDRPWAPFCNATAHLWRVGKDIAATWARITRALDLLANMTALAAPGGWNYPDSLEVGNGDLTADENRAHFWLWCVTTSPLFAI